MKKSRLREVNNLQVQNMTKKSNQFPNSKFTSLFDYIILLPDKKFPVIMYSISFLSSS